ncbi:hypothetical protein AV521_37715 [Streptomyces sp. IMTB 2501]|uniref:hypothetical protein n=1 Tax=Streptomyces sp. IMTB 2501 TaxID=1776340 RepID=UPI00096F47A6|nr:hypothetical protein [Streptomyces sp. IMTB 2501]OLZ63757.1 hypothetical protein AV521_37715 [Streptomyces sp. IMTB 2501]
MDGSATRLGRPLWESACQASPARPGMRHRPREASDAGALLVQPDGFGGFRHASAAPDAGKPLTDAVRRILGHV